MKEMKQSKLERISKKDILSKLLMMDVDDDLFRLSKQHHLKKKDLSFRDRLRKNLMLFCWEKFRQVS